MKIYVTPTGQIRKAIGFPEHYTTSDPIPAKRQDGLTFEIQFLDVNGSPRRKESGAFIAVAFKEVGKYDDPPVAGNSTTARPDEDTGFYRVTVDLSGSEIADLLLVDGDSSNDLSSVDLLFEIAVSESGGAVDATDWERSQTVYANVSNNVFRVTDTFPSGNPKLLHYDFTGIPLDSAARSYTYPKRAGFDFYPTGVLVLIEDETLATSTVTDALVSYGESNVVGADGVTLSNALNDISVDGETRVVAAANSPLTAVTEDYLGIDITNSGTTGVTATIRLLGYEEPTP